MTHDDRNGGANKTIDHSGDSTKMVTQFDERVDDAMRNLPLGHRYARLILDMHAHIVQLEHQ